MVAALSTTLADRDWSVLTAGPPGVLEGLVRQDAVVRLGGSSVITARRRIAALARRVDVVHAHGLTAGWLAATVRSRPPLVVSVHNLVLDEAAGRAAPVLRRLEGLLPAMADRTIALSPEVARRFAGHRGAGRIRIIGPAAAAPAIVRRRDEVRTDLGVGDGEHLVVAGASRLHPQKDIPTLLRACALLDDVRLAVFGTGPDEAMLRGLADELGIAPRVVFGGQRPSLTDELAAADAVVVPSLWESGPLMLVEAMSLGVPVVSTPVGLATTLVEDGITGRLVPIGQPGEMAAAIRSILEQPAVARRLALAGQERALQAHGPTAMTAATEAVYREVL